MVFQAQEVDSLRKYGLGAPSFSKCRCIYHLVFRQEAWIAGLNEVQADVAAFQTLTVNTWAMMRRMPSPSPHSGNFPF